MARRKMIDVATMAMEG